MTNNQIQYWRNVEQRRANTANELETRRSNVSREAETSRHNKEMERLQRKSNANTLLGIQTNERIAMQQLSETSRANKAKERELETSRIADTNIRRRQASTANYNALTSRAVADETARSNRAREEYNLSSLAELQRSNVSNEATRAYQATIADYTAKTNRDLNERRLLEQRRSNQASELIQRRGQNLQLVGNLANALARSASQVLSLKGVRR